LRHFGRAKGSGSDASFEEGLLNWLKKQLEEYELPIHDFKNSFNDGKALLALVHRWDPAAYDYFKKDLKNSVQNVTEGLKLIEQHIKVPALLDPVELTKGETREKQIVLYLSLIQKSFQDEEEKRRLAGEGQAKVLSLREQLTLLNEENATMSESISVLQEKVDVLTKLLEAETEEKNELKSETEALQSAKDSLEKEKKLLTVERDDLVKQLKAAKRAREELEEAVQAATKRNGLGLDAIRKNLLEHVSDLNVWKEFLEQDRDYKNPKVTITSEDSIKSQPFEGQIGALTKELSAENDRLETLLQGRRDEAKGKDKMFSDDDGESKSASKSPDTKKKK
jgi:chromosome segregation ATPase